ncbi:hypothetical protein V7200_17805 [Cytobacillus firmus]|uniref:Uncharacterized protein n=1 Tax=Cytobacillus firmus TaxID=1399 RepID=A0A800NDY4_CYTFI|nr:hypothetical protein [Cytobacillus firmus]KAF0825139.1 hypothetical protein KIS1582_1152 [Cytobacillus firmus]
MDKGKQERLRFLEEQLLWSMKRIVEYALDVELSYSEGEALNLRLIELKEDVIFLEKKLEMDFH